MNDRNQSKAPSEKSLNGFRFVESHVEDIKTILREMKGNSDNKLD
jgi:hypothetical protein